MRAGNFLILLREKWSITAAANIAALYHFKILYAIFDHTFICFNTIGATVKVPLKAKKS
jgi:hypothetical protein